MPAMTSAAGHGAVQKQDLDQLAGAFGVAVDLGGLGPERVMRGCERNRCGGPGPAQSSRATPRVWS